SFTTNGGKAPVTSSRYGESETRRTSSGTAAANSTNSNNSSPDFEEFKMWLKRVTPSMQWEFRHQVYIYKYLKRVFDGDLKRLMIFMPPRHGKSETVTKHFAAYWLKNNPSKNIILGSYNQQLAKKFSRGIRRVLADDAATGSAGIPARPYNSENFSSEQNVSQSKDRCSGSPHSGSNL